MAVQNQILVDITLSIFFNRRGRNWRGKPESFPKLRCKVNRAGGLKFEGQNTMKSGLLEMTSNPTVRKLFCSWLLLTELGVCGWR
jgi:hypothetical protein